MPHSPQSLPARHALHMESSGDWATAVSRPLETASALVVEPSLDEALSTVSLLTANGFQVTVVETFTKAKDRMGARPPNVLVTAIRLAEYNGLHLVLRGKALKPTMAALVISKIVDPVLQADAEAMGATFVVRPIAERELAAAIFRTLFQNAALAGPIRPPFERRSAERRENILDFGSDRRSGERRRDLHTLLGSI